MSEEQLKTLKLTAKIVTAYAASNNLSKDTLVQLIGDTFTALDKSGSDSAIQKKPKKPAVPISKSIKPDYLICLESGKRFQMLKKHLRTNYNMSQDQYRDRWGLADDYPMVAPNYSKRRSKIAKDSNLGFSRSSR